MVHASEEPPTPPPPVQKVEPVRLLSDDDVRPLVPPGRLVFCQGRDGVFEAQSADHTLEPLQAVQVTPRAVDDHSLDAIAFSLRAVKARRGSSPVVKPAPLAPAKVDEKWAPCAVCGSDVTWTSSVRGSDTARAYSTHHCRACGRAVCAFCAPAADSVAADALGETLTLPDKRVTLPSKVVSGPFGVPAVPLPGRPLIPCLCLISTPAHLTTPRHGRHCACSAAIARVTARLAAGPGADQRCCYGARTRGEWAEPRGGGDTARRRLIGGFSGLVSNTSR